MSEATNEIDFAIAVFREGIHIDFIDKEEETRSDRVGLYDETKVAR